MLKRAQRSAARLANVILILQAIALTSAIGLRAAPITDAAQKTPATASPQEEAVLAGGCFWGVEAVFERLKGVSHVVSGFAGGSRWNAHYEIVSLGITGHAESVKITYDPSQITFRQLLQVYFSAAHDPTQLNRQGPDEGTQYRSSIFYVTEAQKQVALAYIQQLKAADTFTRPIVTTVVPFNGFYPAAAAHQDFLDRHPTHPYIVINDLPKLKRLNDEFPHLVKED